MELIESCFLTSDVIYHKCATLGGSTEHYTVAIGNPERHVRKASHRGSKQQ